MIRTTLNIIVAVALLAWGYVSIFGMPFQSQNKQWTEDVLLANGQQIVVTRKVIGNETLGGIGDAGGWEFKATEIHFSKTMPGAPGPLSTHFKPMVLDQTAQGQWYVLGIIQMCEDWKQIGYSKLPYIQYNWDNGQWQQVAFNPEFIGQTANLLVAVRKSGEPPHHTLQSKEFRLTQHTISKEYRKIVERWATSCTNSAGTSGHLKANENTNQNIKESK